MQRGYVLLIWVCFAFSSSALILMLTSGVAMVQAMKSISQYLTQPQRPTQAEVNAKLAEAMNRQTEAMNRQSTIMERMIGEPRPKRRN